jgi:dihydrofolate reductase
VSDPNQREAEVGTIKVHEFISLDGVFEDPSWTFGYPFDPKMGAGLGAIMGSCAAILLGRTTYQQFASAWSGRSAADDPGAPFMNETPKYVISSGQPDTEWNNSTVLGPYSPTTVGDLKDRVAGGLYVSGSGTLVRALLADGLVDELHLFVYPVVLGRGQRLFGDDAGTSKLDLAGCETFSNGVIYATYRSTKG